MLGRKSTILLALGLFWVSGAFAQKLGYINSEVILSEFEEFREAQSKLEVEGKRIQDQYYSMAGRLDSLQQEYERQKFIMTEANRKAKETEIKSLSDQLRQFQVEKLGPQGEIYQKQQAIAAPILDKINKAIKKVGQDYGYDFIFDTVQGNILYAKDSYDLTNVVLNELRKGGAK